MSTQRIDRYAYQVGAEDSADLLLSHRSPRFGSAEQFGAFCQAVASYDPARMSVMSPTAVVMEVMAMKCVVDASPRPYIPDPVPYHDGWIRRVYAEALTACGAKAMRAWVLVDVSGMSGRSIADSLQVGREHVAGLLARSRAAIEDALRGGGYLDL